MDIEELIQIVINRYIENNILNLDLSDSTKNRLKRDLRENFLDKDFIYDIKTIVLERVNYEEELKNTNKIIINKEIRNGQPILSGTRLTIIDILLLMIDFVRDYEKEFRANYADISVEQIVLAFDYFINNSIPVQKIKDIIDRIDYDIKKTKEIISKNTNIFASYRKNDYQIVRLKAMNTKSLDIKKRLRELLESEE